LGGDVLKQTKKTVLQGIKKLMEGEERGGITVDEGRRRGSERGGGGREMGCCGWRGRKLRGGGGDTHKNCLRKKTKSSKTVKVGFLVKWNFCRRKGQWRKGSKGQGTEEGRKARGSDTRGKTKDVKQALK